MQKYDNKPFTKMASPIFFNILRGDILPSQYLATWQFVYFFDPSGKVGAPISYSTIASHLKVSRRTIANNIDYLTKNGFIDKSPFNKLGGWGVNILKCTIPESLQAICDDYKDRNTDKPQQKEPPNDIKNLPNESDFIHNKKIIIINNNNHNVGCETSETEQETIKSHIDACEKDLFEANSSLEKANSEYDLEVNSPKRDNVKTFELLQTRNRASSLVDQIESRIKYLQKQIDDRIAISKIRGEIEIDQEFVNNLPGERKISGGLMWWISKKLNDYGIDPSSMPRMLNEMIHSIRFGSFSIVKYSKIREPMPLMKSVNCCLKLIREGKWQSPASYQYGAIYA